MKSIFKKSIFVLPLVLLYCGTDSGGPAVSNANNNPSQTGSPVGSLSNPYVAPVPTASAVSSVSRSGISGDYYIQVPVTPDLVEGYEITLDGLDGFLDFRAYSGSDFASGNNCGASGSSVASAVCTLILPAGSANIYIKVTTNGVTGSPLATTFAISVRVPNSGELGNPIATSVIKFSGTTPAAAGLYYKITTTASTGYDVSIGALSGDLDLGIYSSNGYNSTTMNSGNYISQMYCSSANTGITSEVCGSYSDASGSIYIQVKNVTAPGAYSFTLTLATPAAGSLASPIVLTGPTMGKPSSLNIKGGKGSSLYYVTSIKTGYGYGFQIGNITGSIDFYVYSDQLYTNLLCSSVNYGSQNRYCGAFVTDPAVSQLYIKAVPGSLSSGTLTISLGTSMSTTMSAPTLMGTPRGGASMITTDIVAGANGTAAFDSIGSDIYMEYTVAVGNPYMVKIFNISGNRQGTIEASLGVGTVDAATGVFTAGCVQDNFTGSVNDSHDEVCMFIPTTTSMVVAVNTKNSTGNILVSVEVAAGTGVLTAAGTLIDIATQLIPSYMLNNSINPWTVDVALGNAAPSLLSSGNLLPNNSSSCIGYAVDTTGWAGNTLNFDYITSSDTTDALGLYLDNQWVASYSGNNAAWVSSSAVSLVPNRLQTIMWCYEHDSLSQIAGTDDVRLDNILSN